MRFSRLHPLAFLLLFCGLLAAGRSLVLRSRVEQRNLAVELVLDFNQVRFLSGTTGHPVRESLVQLQAAGARGVAVTEELMQDLVSSGRLRLERVDYGSTGEIRTTLRTRDPRVFERIATAVRAQLPQMRQPAADPRAVVRVLGPGGLALDVPHARWEDLVSLPIGLDPYEVALVREAGLDPVARIYNHLGSSPHSIDHALRALAGYGVRTVIFAGEDVLGFKGSLKETAAGLERYGLRYGSVEFGKQQGDEALSRLVEARLIRVHSVAPAELARMAEPDIIDRFARAAAERNIRILYVRFPRSATGDAYRDTLEYVRKIARRIEGDGFRLAVAHPVDAVAGGTAADRFLGPLMGAGTGAAGLLLLASLFPIARGAQAALALLFAAGGAGAVLLLGGTGRELAAFAAALVFPTLAFVWFPQPVGAFARPGGRAGGLLPAALGRFGLISGVTLLGAALVAGILSHRLYLLKLDGFAGIKLAHLLPVLLVAAFYLLGLGNGQGWTAVREGTRRRVRGFLAEPIRFGHAVALVAGVAIFGILLLRTGNDPGMAVSPLEMKFRTLLEQHLVRPRTKEFLIGHPALLLGLAMAASARWRRWALLPLVAGVIGQVSMVNSFCHLHTPLGLTVARTANGLWLGALIGAAGIVLLELLGPRLLPAPGREGNPEVAARAAPAPVEERLPERAGV